MFIPPIVLADSEHLPKKTLSNGGISTLKKLTQPRTSVRLEIGFLTYGGVI